METEFELEKVGAIVQDYIAGGVNDETRSRREGNVETKEKL